MTKTTRTYSAPFLAFARKLFERKQRHANRRIGIDSDSDDKDTFQTPETRKRLRTEAAEHERQAERRIRIAERAGDLAVAQAFTELGDGPETAHLDGVVSRDQRRR